MNLKQFLEDTYNLKGYNTKVFMCFMSKSYHENKSFDEVLKDSDTVTLSFSCDGIILDPCRDKSVNTASLLDIRGLSFDVGDDARLVYDDEDHQAFQPFKSYVIGKYFQYDAIVLYCGG